ncbi:hypothetical protein An01g00830 [Aspergillus niger]|uniref:TF-B3 domain-containing protein n=2 Tax=Aspergillus niger TaxID=5061 RepID=A2Q7I5_ASPNC|nr:hypothetical protein An01g00830 [Aspergillus niger]CAK43461.1 hypothetical protein An01g00830 [Aspergillus niger]
MTVVNSKATVMEWKAKLTAKIELDSQSLESGMDHGQWLQYAKQSGSDDGQFLTFLL